jgi:hypothetical protein
MSARREFSRAMTRRAEAAASGAALIIRGLLLLSAP